jgi:hypothetical protein
MFMLMPLFDQKKRGKRPLPPRDAGEEDSDNKKAKRELSEFFRRFETSTFPDDVRFCSAAYEKEVQKYESRILKDQGSGVRSVMK